ncbi:MAG: ABC transporter ATP-binding protein [Candidatus Lambdaproteobacteria bacterium]|nr:ABC transporter ATP-binding protein [Candidatus Lambdaproteobacteria bacterium]
MLQLDHLYKRFGGLEAIGDLSLAVPEGQLLGIIGPNGAGKTTMLNLVTGYLRPSKGQILFDGRRVAGLPPYRIAALGVSRTFQIVQPFHEMTVAENVLVGSLFLSGRRRSIAEMRRLAEGPLETVGLQHRAADPAGALTFGDKKKLELARALASRPRLLLLDEVMSGLNRAEIGSMCDIVRQVHRAGTTVIMIEHLVQVILTLCERVFVLDFGHELFQGAPGEVMQHPEVIASYLGKQLEREVQPG